MSDKVIKTKILQRIDTETNWKNVNPILLNGEIAFVQTENDNIQMKIGNGNHYNDIPFFTKDKINELSSKIDSKISINSQLVDTVNIRYISRDDYYELVNSETGALSNEIYIISSDNLNAYDQKIENVADGEKDTDAVNLGQLKNYINNIICENNDLIYVNYETLCNLKDIGKLITGKTYCLTDYYVGKGTAVTYKECQLNGDNETKFDILITAISPNILSEHCKAITYDNKEYEIWYCLKYETERFEYPDIFERGIIYRMIDDNDNDLPYDFKSISINNHKLENKAHHIKICSNNNSEKYSMNFCDIEGVCYNIQIGSYCYLTHIINSSNIILGNYCQNNYIFNSNDITFGNNCVDNTISSTKQLRFGSKCVLNQIQNSNNIHFGFNCQSNHIGTNVENPSNGDEIKTAYNISIDDDSSNNYIANESYNINIGKTCNFIIFGTDVDNLYKSHNITINNDVTVVKFFDLPENEELQNVEIKSGIHNKDIYITYENMLYRDILSTIAPKSAYNLTI